MIRPLLALGLLLGTSHAQTTTVIAPVGDGPDTSILAAELSEAIDRALAVTPRLSRMNRDALLPDDLAITFGCVTVDVPCARAAGRAAGTERVLLPRFEQRGDRLSVRIDLLATSRARDDRRSAWLVGPLSSIDDPRLQVALRYIARGALTRGVQRAVLIPAPGTALVVEGRPLRPMAANPVRANAVTIASDDLPPWRIEVAAGEVRFVDPPTALSLPDEAAPADGRRVAAWLVTGASAAALAAASIVAVQLNATQGDYDRTANGPALDELKSRGEQQALTANALFVTAGLGAAVAALLFWGPGS